MSGSQSRFSQIWPDIRKKWRASTSSTTSYVFDIIPPELIEEIVAHIPTNQETTLRSLALASHVFLNPCQRRLFSKLDIDLAAKRQPTSPSSVDGRSVFVPWTASIPAYQRLRDIFKNSPHLAGYVMKLSFVQSRGQRGGEWMIGHSSLFADITTSLSSSPIHTISLQGYSYFSAFEWDSLPLEAERNLYRLFSNPNLQTLVMVDVLIPKTFFHGFRELKHLKLAHIGWSTDDHITPTTIEFRSGLQGVQKITSLYLVPWGLRGPCERLDLTTITPERGLDLTDLDHVLLRINTSNHPPSASLTRLRPSKLRVLELEFFDDINKGVAQALNLSSFHALSRLTISHHDNGAGTNTGFSKIIETISSLPTHLHLHSLILNLNNQGTYTLDQFSKIQILSSTFSRLQDFSSCLELISIRINIYTNISDDAGQVLVLKDYIFKKVRWDGCESILEVAVSVGGS